MSGEKPHIRIYKWDELQHYKDREPPWIKLYNRLLDHYQFGQLPDAVKGHYMGLLMLRSRYGEPLPLDVDWLASRINATQPLDLRPLVSADLIELYHHDRQPLAQDDSNTLPFARSREAETEADERQSTSDSLPTVENTDGASPDVENSPEDVEAEREAEWDDYRGELAGAIKSDLYEKGQPPDLRVKGRPWSTGRDLSITKQLVMEGHGGEKVLAAVRGYALMVNRRHEAVAFAEHARRTLLPIREAEQQGVPLIEQAASYWYKQGASEMARAG